MSRFGLTHDQILLFKKNLQEVFGAQTDVKVYLFGSRATGKNRRNSDIDLAFKSKDINLDKKITIFKERIQDSIIPYKLDAVNWDHIVKEYLPVIKKQRIPFWDASEIITPWRRCPLGFHWVKEHMKEGNQDKTDSHCRKNPNRFDLLKAEEIEQISQNELFTNPRLKASIENMGFGGREHKYDHLINGWCAYWNDIIKPKDPLHPDFIKILIATESSFEINPPRTEKHTAIGITQIMPRTIGLLSSRSSELKNHFLELTKEEVFDPNINICASIRWLFRKYELAKRKKGNLSWLDALEEYKGILKDKDPKSNRIRLNLLEYLKQLRPE